ncbi:solute carrier family 2, facilitated glucose transporter member 11-like, partial [Ahaetulla prasina]|uniref:solute carrier family 2, facilitated glucose transporter member 11-like n=1 Tax=Ahaetulla prasina TaxID=499056 RepID=UPI00264720A9
GRKKSLLLNNVFVALAALLVGFSRVAKSFEMILLSRFFAGINSGVAMSIQPMYLGESAPKELRGAVAMTSASFTALGLVLGQVAGLREILGAEENWPILLASNVVPGLIQLLLLPWAPESPRYLLIDRGDQDSCISALQQLRGSSDLSSEMKEILAEQAALQGQAAKAPWELWRNRAVRWQFFTVVVLSSAMQLCGNDSMYFYASYVFQEAGIPYDKIQYSVIGTGSCELIMSMTCNLLIECVGRRVLLIGGYSLMATWAILFMVALSLQDQFSWMPYLSMACIFAYILSFGIGPAGVTGIIPTEIFDQVARPAAYTISGSLLWINLFLVGLAFPFVMESLGYYCYLPFFTVCVGTALYVWFFLPETKGKSLLEISEEFIKRNFGANSSLKWLEDLSEDFGVQCRPLDQPEILEEKSAHNPIQQGPLEELGGTETAIDAGLANTGMEKQPGLILWHHTLIELLLALVGAGHASDARGDAQLALCPKTLAWPGCDQH